MQNAIWKLTALAGVAGVGFLVVLQAQKNLSHRSPGTDLAQKVVEQDTDDPPPTNVAQNSETPQPPGEFSPDPNASPIPQRAPSADPAVQSAVHNAEGSNPFDAMHASESQAAESASSQPAPPAPEAAPASPSPEPDPFAGFNASVPPQQPPAAETAAAAAPTQDEPPPQGEQPEPADEFQAAPELEVAAEPADQPPAAESGNAPAGAPAIIPANAEQPSTPEGSTPAVDDAAFEEPPGKDGEEPPGKDDESDDDTADSPAGSGPSLLGPNPLEAPSASPTEESPSNDNPDQPSENTQLEPSGNSASDDSASESNKQQPAPGGSPATLVPDPNAFTIDTPAEDPVEPASDERSDRPEVGQAVEGNGGPFSAPGDQGFDTPPSDDSDSPTGPAGLSSPPPAQAGDQNDKTNEDADSGIAPKDPEGSEPSRFDPPPEATRISAPADNAVTVTNGAERPQLKIEKIAPPTAVLGQPLIYHIVLSNGGTSTAHQVTVEDRIPEGAELSGTIPRAVLTGNRLVWKLGDLEPGKSQKISIRVTPRTPGRIGSVATVNFVSEVASQTMVTAPKLELALSAPPQAKVGDPVEVHFKVSNSGTGDAESVVIRSILPDELQHPGGSDLEYEVGRLAAGETKEVQLTLTAAQVGDAVSRAVVTATGGVTVESKASVRVVGSNLVISRTGPEHRYLGRDAVYQNVVTNKSSKPVEGATLIETVPEGMEFVEATEGGQYNDGDRTVAWRLETLGPGESKIVKVTLRATEPGTKTSRVTAVELSGAKTEATSQTEVQGFASVGVDVPPIEGPVAVGETLVLRLATQNRGNFEASNVKLKLTIPPELQVVSVKSPVRYTQTGPNLEFAPQPTLDPDKATDFEVSFKALQSGDVRVGIEIQADQMQRPLRREEAIIILPAN